MVQELPFVLATPPASASIERLDDTRVILRVTGGLLRHRTDFAVARGEALRLVKAALEAAAVGIPEGGLRLRLGPQAPGAGAAPTAAPTAAPSGTPAPAAAARPTSVRLPRPAVEAPVSGDVGTRAAAALDRVVAAERTQAEELLSRGGPGEGPRSGRRKKPPRGG
jgi:hypothetical protein